MTTPTSSRPATGVPRGDTCRKTFGARPERASANATRGMPRKFTFSELIRIIRLATTTKVAAVLPNTPWTASRATSSEPAISSGVRAARYAVLTSR